MASIGKITVEHTNPSAIRQRALELAVETTSHPVATTERIVERAQAFEAFMLGGSSCPCKTEKWDGIVRVPRCGNTGHPDDDRAV